MKKIINEFKEFALGSNIIGLATAVIMGAAANSLVSTLVDSILMPIIGIFMGGVSLSSLSYTFGDAVIKYGMFIQALLDFFIIALCVFLVVKASNTLQKKLNLEKEKKEKEPTSEDYLKEIRDLLERENKI